MPEPKLLDQVRRAIRVRREQAKLNTISVASHRMQAVG